MARERCCDSSNRENTPIPRRKLRRFFLSPCPGNASEESERTRIVLCSGTKTKNRKNDCYDKHPQQNDRAQNPRENQRRDLQSAHRRGCSSAVDNAGRAASEERAFAIQTYRLGDAGRSREQIGGLQQSLKQRWDSR